MLGYDDLTLRSTWGVYAFVNRLTGRVYIGQTSNNFLDRVKMHLFQLERGKHDNAALQWDWVLFGSENFDFYILDSFTGKGVLYWALYREWIHIRKSKNLYNVCMPGPNVTSGAYPSHACPERWALLPADELP